MMREKLFTVHRKDFKIEFFRAGGKGGQKQNKTSSACRITHVESGAVGECRNFREQWQNRRSAFNRLYQSDRFQKWLRIAIAKAAGRYADLNDKVDQDMTEANLKIETWDGRRWIDV